MLNELEFQTFIEAVKFFLHKNNCPREVSVLERAELEFEYLYENWCVSKYSMNLRLTPIEYLDYQQNESQLEANILSASNVFLKDQDGSDLVSVRICPKLKGPLDKVSLSGTEKTKILADLDELKSLLISVSTGGPKINTVNGEYQLLRAQLATSLKPFGVDISKIYTDLWAWYSVWSTNLPNYQGRRDHVTSLINEVTEAVKSLVEDNLNEVEETGWAKVDRGIREIKIRFREASTEEQFNAVGVLCRETLTNVAQAVFDPEIHAKYSDIPPSPTDSKRMIDCYFSHELSGNDNENLRRFAKNAINLANELTHRRTINRRDASICVNATFSTINIIFAFTSTRGNELF